MEVSASKVSARSQLGPGGFHVSYGRVLTRPHSCFDLQPIFNMTTPAVFIMKPCFFNSDSENEEENYPMQTDAPTQSAILDTNSATGPEAVTVAEVSDIHSKKRLFLASSDDEEDNVDIDVDAILQRRADDVRDSPDRHTSPRPRESSVVSSIKSRSSPAPVKKQKVTPPTTKTPAPLSTKKSNKPITQTKKADGKPTAMSRSLGFESMYLGSFLVPNAWSTCKGRGWVQTGETIEINRTDDDKYSKKTANGGQLKLTSMFKVKSQAAKPIKKGKEDNVVRFTNSRGFEIGRLPQNIASWVSKLLDKKIIAFKHCTVVDCPESLHTGAEMLIQLRVYLLADAFKPQKTINSEEENHHPKFKEGQESYDEQQLRQRKSSLLQLFKAVDLKPHMKNTLLKQSSAQVLEKVAKDGQQLSKEKEKAANQSEGEEDSTDDVLDDTQVDMIYKKAQKNDQTMAEMEPADTFTLILRPYQKQALRWMYALECGKINVRDANSMHPLWEEYLFPYEELADDIIDITEEREPFYFNPYSGELSMTFPRAEKKCRGGILADEMGMGKTIMISSLLHSSRDPEIVDDGINTSGQRQLRLGTSVHSVVASRVNASALTLIVAPTSLITQWASELERSSAPGSINLLVWHGANREDLDAFALNGKINVVITSYGVLGSEWTRNENGSGYGSPLYQIEWLRVVLDEAHNCKSRSSRTAKACHALKAQRRWALTGTPIVNRLEDLYSLLKFLDFTPWSDYSFFRSFITIPFLNRDPKAIEIVQVILESVLLRREKKMRDRDGKPIVELPNKEVTIERLEFSPLERRIYDSMYTDAKKNFEQLKAKGLVGKNYTHILAMLMRLRRAVLHPSLVQLNREESMAPEGHNDNSPISLKSLLEQFSGTNNTDQKSEGISNTFAEGVLTNLEEVNQQECAVCLDLMENPVLVPNCLHTCCKSCALAFLLACEEKGEEGYCPVCRSGPVKESQLLEVVKSYDPKNSSASSVVLRKNDFNYSTKLKALMEDLCRLRDQDPCFRVVIFSQFTSFLDLIEVVLRRDNFVFYRFDGDMNIKSKAFAVEEFTKPSRNGKIFIVSLKAGGVGLNLTVADHVYMMDCWWNSAIEQQAIDRVHRIGQERTVYVKHFIISRTIEDRILQIQKRKTAIVKGALGDTQGQDKESMENLKIMFGEDV